MLEKLEHEGPVEIVDEKNLTRLMDNGWVLLATYEIEIPSWDYDSVDRINGRVYHGIPAVEQSDGHRITRRESTQDHFNIRQRRFVVGQPKDAYFKELRQRVEKVRAEALEATKELPDLRREVKAREKEIEDAKAKHESLRMTYSRLLTSDATARAGLRALEIDMGKVRKSIGDARWGEIVGAGE